MTCSSACSVSTVWTTRSSNCAHPFQTSEYWWREENVGLYVHRNHSGLLGTGKLGGSGLFISNTYSPHCHQQNSSALRRPAVWDILMCHWLCGQSHKTVSINHKFCRERRAESDWTEIFLLISHTAGPHRLKAVIYDHRFEKLERTSHAEADATKSDHPPC